MGMKAGLHRGCLGAIAWDGKELPKEEMGTVPFPAGFPPGAPHFEGLIRLPRVVTVKDEKIPLHVCGR